jgi:hypothetical protein
MSEHTFLTALMMVAVGVAFLGTLNFLRRYLELRNERRPPIGIDALEQRLERIESVVEATAVEVERISEANRFMAKLLADPVGAGSPAGRAERVGTPR